MSDHVDHIEDGMSGDVNRDEDRARKLQALRADLQKGLDSLDRGEGRPWDVEEAKARLLARFRQRERAL